ncbi:MAG: hypothetical protein JW751_18075 [Polyangiaceae bacterium]|nr:hypothetical protein [Polyangiaceae bacterium]
MRLTQTIIATLVVIAATGCSVETGGTDIGTIDQGLVCQNDEGVQMMQAALAVAIGRELKRWDGLQDFTPKVFYDPWYKERLALTTAGEARCTANGGCPGVKAILDMQKVNYFIPGANLWNGDSFAAKMTAGWRRLQSDIQNQMCRDFTHSLETPTAAVGDGCGQLDFSFEVIGNNPGAVECQMALFTGGGTYDTNPWIDFRVSESRAIIDPSDGTVVGSSTPTLDCWDAPSGFVYDPMPKKKIGQCCAVAGSYKTLYAYTTNWDKCR